MFCDAKKLNTIKAMILIYVLLKSFVSRKCKSAHFIITGYPLSLMLLMTLTVCLSYFFFNLKKKKLF